MNIDIRHEAASDAPAIEAVTRSAFANAAHTSHTEHLIVDRLRTAGQLSVSLVAEVAGQLVGHVAISPVSIADGAPAWFGLGPVSVLPQHQRGGVGTRLVREALSALRGLGAQGCVVLGDSVFYRRFGFQPDADLVLPEVPAEYFQALRFGTSQPHGVVSYHSAFNQ